MQNIMKRIYMNGDLQTGECKPSYSEVPWLEITHKEINTDDRPSPCLFVTHLPYQLIPKALKNKTTKVIYVYRNPKDVAVSYYHFHKFANYLETPENFGVFLQAFLNGQELDVASSDGLSGISSGIEKKFLYFTFIPLQDLRVAVLKFINFLGRSLDNKSVDIIVECSTFKNMKSNPKSNYENAGFPTFDNSFAGFMRKGIIGDWKNHFTVAENEMFDRLFQEKMEGLPLKYSWEINN
ncbi:amine sulfotransferase-like [Stegostoma tigrinum]|uniref:amine sulfotransferase-like n=1 Tax=Stegostoma tigrinum TaxID=3053191 RepID=UPI0028702AD8|nr:amine sulfotransferase-like [Stegostoma tigrinum]